MLKDKRGLGLNSAYAAILTIVLVGIILGLGLYILAETRSGITTDYNDFVSTNISNPVTMPNASATTYALESITSIVGNGTGTAVTNYTYTSAGVITFGVNLNGTIANISTVYTYDKTGSPESTMTATITGLATFADWIAIIVVVLAAAVVLGVVLSSFGGRSTGI